MTKLNWLITCCLVVFSTMLFTADVSTVTVYAGGTDCSGPLGLVSYLNGSLRGPYDLEDGLHYTEKVSHEQKCAPADGTDSVTMEVSTYSANKYNLSGNVSYAPWFNLSGNWESETVSVSRLEKKCEFANGTCDGPCYIYEKRPYSQKYKVMAKQVPVHSQNIWIYCEPCYAILATLKKEPSLEYTASPKSEYVPPQKTDLDACSNHSY